MDTPDADPVLPPRAVRGHKGTFGTVAVVGGCAARPDEDGRHAVRMLGGPALSALASLRAGAGLARLAMPEPVLSAALTIAPEATGLALAVDHAGEIVPHHGAAAIDELLESTDCLAIGPGLGRGAGPRALVVRACAQDAVPIVIDADGVHALAETPEINRDFRAPAVITPHVGEFRRLSEALGIGIDPQEKPEEAAAALAQRLGCVVVLKSAATAVSDGVRSWLHDEPNPALATAGSGDVLTGITSGLIAQHYRRHLGAGERTLTSDRQGGVSLYDAARLAVLAHAHAGARWVKRNLATGGLIASELLAEIPVAVEALRRRDAN